MADAVLKPGVQAAEGPDHPAAIAFGSGEVLTYGQLEGRSRRLAGLWHAQGLRPKDHVAVLLDNTPAYFEVVWAAFRSGLYLTPVNWHLGADEAGYIVKDCGARAIVSAPSLAPLLSAMGDALDGVESKLLIDRSGAGVGGGVGGGSPTGGPLESWGDYDQALAGATPIDPADEREGIYMFYSSGTTGRPKGIKPPLADVPYGTGGMLDALTQGLYGFHKGMTYLCPAPLYHAAPLAWSMSAQRLGGTIIVLEKFDAADALAAIERYGITHGQFVPTHFVRMLKLDPETRTRYDLSSLQMAVHAAAPCPPEVKESMLDWWGPVVHEYYSGSEGAGFCAIGPDEWRAHRGSVGKSLGGAIHIVGPAGEDLPVGEAGQVWFESQARFEYHGDPVKTAEAINPQGWVTIGDIGYLDDEGYLYLTDRVAHTVISGGVNIYPREIEDVLVVHPSVTDVAVIGVPDDEMGESLLAVVQAAADVTAEEALGEELRTYAREHLAGFKVPRRVTFVDELPRLPTGKIRKSELRQRYGSWSGAASTSADR